VYTYNGLLLSVSLTFLIPLLRTMVFLTLTEWEVRGYAQLHTGPDIIKPQALLHPMIETITLFVQDPSHPSSSLVLTLFPVAPPLSQGTSLSPLPWERASSAGRSLLSPGGGSL
uniref:Uncharacterized protein n=1 Tax=Ursus maritimus TaxID=29073 RepID=A0A452TPB0_URSMA